MSFVERARQIVGWWKKMPTPAKASVLGGLVLVVMSFIVDGQWSAVALEVGAGLGLVVVVYQLERVMTEQLELRQDEKFDAMEQRLESRIAAHEAAAAVVQQARRDRSAVADAFVEDPTPETLALLADEAEDVAVPRPVQLAVADGWLLHVAPTRHPYQPGGEPRPIVQLKVIKQSPRQNRPSEAVNWKDDQSYEDMLAALRRVWARFDADWPGDEQFSNTNFPRLIADSYTHAIDQRMAGVDRG